MRVLRLTGSIFAACALLLAAPAAAEVLPRPEALGASETMLRELSDMLVSRQPDNGARLARLDVLLAQAREPNLARGFVQFLRAVHLQELRRQPEARVAIEESMRLLPGYSGPLLFAASLEAYADRPAAAADYLLRASEIDPGIVRQMPPYELRNVVDRLDSQKETRRLGRVAERMIAINWEGSDVTLRSLLGREAIRSRSAAGDTEGARSLVPRLVSPTDLRVLLIDNRYRALWPDIETWGGMRQERQWPLYLAELRARYEASQDLEAGQRYASALRLAGHHATLVRVFAPLFARPLDRREDYDLLWVAPAVADALARLGRWSEIDPMFERAARVWPLGSDANAINVAGNRARFQLYAGDASGAVASLDRVIADATARVGEVSRGALATIHLYRACALEAAGRGHQAVQSVAEVFAAGQPVLSAQLHLCFGRMDAARAALIDGLSGEATRDDVLRFVQPDDEPPMQSDYGRRSAAAAQALRTDRALLSAVARYGRVLPASVSAGAPPEQ